MKPWDPILRSIPGGEVPVALPIQVDLWADDLEALWWAHLLASLCGLRAVYHRLGDQGQVYRTGRIVTKTLGAIKKLYFGMADGIQRSASMACAARVSAWDWHQDPIGLEAGWWAQAAYCAHALSAGYQFSGGMGDGRALLAADVLRSIRERVACALPEAIAKELLALATSTAWGEACPNLPTPGTTPEPGSEEINLENA